MKNLLAFLKRFRIFLIFALLQVAVLSFYFNNVQFPKTQFFSTAGKVNAQLLSYSNEVKKHLFLAESNKRLQEENSALRRLLKEQLWEYDTTSFTIKDSLFKQQYTYIPATVVHSTYNKRNNYITLKAGKAQGIERGMGVFSAEGIVGIVYNVSEHFSVVKTVLTENINVDVMVKKTGEFGLLKWNGSNPRVCQIAGISNDLPVKKWTTIVTRGGSGIFPKGIPVGKIKRIGDVEGKPLWDIDVLLAADLRKIQYVYVIKNLMLEEQRKVEAAIPIEE